MTHAPRPPHPFDKQVRQMGLKDLTRRLTHNIAGCVTVCVRWGKHATEVGTKEEGDSRRKGASLFSWKREKTEEKEKKEHL